MHEHPPFRPPSEAFSLLIRATRGCPWNRCEFCMMYKGQRFEIKTVEEIKSDIDKAREFGERVRELSWRLGYGGDIAPAARLNGILWLYEGCVKTAFIGDSNSIVMKTDRFAQLLRYLYEVFPTLERVTSYGRAKTVLKKPVAELKIMGEAGLSRLHLGLESGDDELLQYINKGVDARGMINAGRKVKEAGISLSEYVILGLGGKSFSEKHATGTARVLNEIDPGFIRVRTLFPIPGTPLYEKISRGELSLCEPEDILQEEYRLIEALECGSYFVSDHVSNYLNVEGKFPGDKERMLEQLRVVLKAPPEIRSSIFQPEELRHL